MPKRVSLKDRKAQEGTKGVDLFFDSPVPDAKKAEPALKGAETAKITLYIRTDQVEAVEEIQLNERKRTGKKPSKSDLTIEAFDLLIQKHRNTAIQ